jgi:hypothetical protein
MRFSSLLAVALLASSSSAYALAPFQLFVCNPPALGCEVSLDMCPSPIGGTFILFGSFGTANIPVSPQIGTFLIDPNTMFTFGTGPKTAVCEALRFFVPNIPQAVGVSAYFQAVHIPVSGDPLLSNAAQMTIQNHIPACQYLECF